MSKKAHPNEALALVNKAITNGIDHLHKVQGAVKKGSLHLMVTNRHKPACHGCPHYNWKIWTPVRARSGSGIGKTFNVAVDVKAPTRTHTAKTNSKVMEIVVILSKLLEQRANLVEAISRSERSAAATMKMLAEYTGA